jgi:hypothetical protein
MRVHLKEEEVRIAKEKKEEALRKEEEKNAASTLFTNPIA